VGASLRANRVNAARLAQALGRLVGNRDIDARCRETRARFDGAGPMQALCARLEALAGEGGRIAGQARATAPGNAPE